ncbi:MAG: hypothetical protein ACO3VI_03490, partial [Ilumatobacteraceae bacterium]
MAPPPRITPATRRVIVASTALVVILAAWTAIDQLFLSPRTVNSCRIEPESVCVYADLIDQDLTAVEMSDSEFYRSRMMGVILVDADLSDSRL